MNLKKILLGLIALVIIAAGVLFGVNGSSNYDASKYSLTITPADQHFGTGSTIDFILPDQFDKTHKLSTTTEKLIFAFTKDTGHIVKVFMMEKPEGYLTKRHAVIVADISAMPVVIQNTFALPDLRKSNYSMMLIYDKEMAKQLKEGQEATKVIVMTLKDKKVTKVAHASSEEELGKLLN